MRQELTDLPERNRGSNRWTGEDLRVVSPPEVVAMVRAGFPNYFEDQPTPLNAFRDDEQWLDSEVDLKTNTFNIIFQK